MYSEDRESIERVLAGEPEVFETLVRKYSRMAGAIAYAILKDFHLAEDVVQDAFVKAVRALPTLREPEKFRVWLAELVRSRALDALRRAKSAAALAEASATRPSPRAHGVEEDQIQEELRTRIRAAIDDLPEPDRLVVTLKHMEGLSYKEIAELTGSTVGAVESRLFRARQALKRVLAAIR